MPYSMQSDAPVSLRTSGNPRRRNALLLAAGAALAASALAVRQRTRKAEFDNPPLGEFIEVDGVRLHYVERGEGPPLVLIHGDGSMIQDFVSSGLIDLAAKTHRVIAFDRPGYGYSERPRSTIWTPQAQARLLHRALQALGVEQPIVLAHSWGTLVAASFALEFPEDVKSLVLLSGYYYPTVRADVPVLSLPAIPLVGDLLRYTVSPWLTRLAWPALMRMVFGPAPVPPRFSAEFPVWLALRPSQLRASAADAALLIPAAMSLSRHYHALTVPVTIMSGSDDRYVSMHAHSERLYRDVPQSALHVTRGAGHMLHQVAPQEVMRAIEASEEALLAPQFAQKHVSSMAPVH